MSDTQVKRLYSLDALRGFDMFWIMGGDALAHTLAKATDSPAMKSVAMQFEHPAWNGFTAYDLVFPLFLFLAGVSTPFSIGRQMEKGVPRSKLMWKVVKRGLLLVFLGILTNTGGLQLMPLEEIRFGSVLGRIGLAYMFANIIYLYTGRRAQVIWAAALVVGYWLLLRFTSAPGFAAGDLTMEGNFASYLDRTFMPGTLYLGIHDPEGFASTIPAISTALMGILAGTLLRNPLIDGSRKALYLAIAGIISLVAAQIWGISFPLNKNLWSSSFVLHAGGISLLLLSVFYYVIDVKNIRKWAFFFVVIGMNSILIYLSGIFIEWRYMTMAFFKWVTQLSGEQYEPVAVVICIILVKWALLYLLYKKKIFLKV